MTSRRAELLCKSNCTNQPRRMPGRLAPFPARRCAMLLVLVLAAVGWEAYAQDLEPRAYTNTPVGLNFLLAGYAYSESDPPRTASSEPFLLAPPKEAGPVVVRAALSFMTSMKSTMGRKRSSSQASSRSRGMTHARPSTRLWWAWRKKSSRAATRSMSSRRAGIRRWSSSTPRACTRRTAWCCASARRHLDPDRDPERDGEGGVQHEPIPVRRASAGSRL